MKILQNLTTYIDALTEGIYAGDHTTVRKICGVGARKMKRVSGLHIFHSRGVQTFPDEGSQPLVWTVSRATRVKLIISGTNNHLNYCVIFIGKNIIYNCGSGRETCTRNSYFISRRFILIIYYLLCLRLQSNFCSSRSAHTSYNSHGLQHRTLLLDVPL